MAAEVLDSSTLSGILKSKLTEGLVGNALTVALTPAFGAINAARLGGFFLFTIAGAAATEASVLAAALREHEGILEISYRTSYNGSWYYTSCIDVWHTASSGVVSMPGSYYGNGYYESK